MSTSDRQGFPLNAVVERTRSAVEAGPPTSGDDSLTALPRRTTASLLVSLIAILVVGPYLGHGLRTEHIVVYGSLLLLLVRGEVELRGPALFVLGAQALAFLGVAVSTFTAPSGTRSSFGFSVVRSPLAGADDLLLVMAAVLVGVSLGRTKAGAESALLAVYRGAVVVSVLNLFLQMLQVFGHGQSIFGFFNRGLVGSQIVRYSQDVGGESVFNWDRYPGIFVQPFEGGVFYGLVLLLWAFRWGMHRPQFHALFGCIIVSGAALAGSKAVLPAFGVILVAAVFRWRALPKLRWVSGLAAALPICIGLLFLLRWLAVDPLERLRLDQYTLVSAFTGGRFGSGVAWALAGEILRKSPFAGFGFSGYPVPADTMWTGWLSTGGLFAVAMWVSTLMMVAYAAFRWRHELHNVGIALTCFVIFAGFGGPALSANRSSSLVWIVLALSCLGAWRWPERPAMWRAARSSGRLG